MKLNNLQIKNYINTFKEDKKIYLGEEWITILIDDTNKDSSSDETILVETFIVDKDIIVKGKTENFVENDIIYEPQNNRISFKKLYLNNGRVKYQQLLKKYKKELSCEDKESLLNKWFFYSKKQNLSISERKVGIDYIVKDENI